MVCHLSGYSGIRNMSYGLSVQGAGSGITFVADDVVYAFHSKIVHNGVSDPLAVTTVTTTIPSTAGRPLMFIHVDGALAAATGILINGAWWDLAITHFFGNQNISIYLFVPMDTFTAPDYGIKLLNSAGTTSLIPVSKSLEVHHMSSVTLGTPGVVGTFPVITKPAVISTLIKREVIFGPSGPFADSLSLFFDIVHVSSTTQLTQTRVLATFIPGATGTDGVTQYFTMSHLPVIDASLYD